MIATTFVIVKDLDLDRLGQALTIFNVVDVVVFSVFGINITTTKNNKVNIIVVVFDGMFFINL